MLVTQLSRFIIATYIYVVFSSVTVNGYVSQRFTGRETIVLASWSLVGFILHQFWLLVQCFVGLLSDAPPDTVVKPRDTHFYAIDFHDVS